ncbi:pilus assembly FimT family protein [Halorhodospira halophila]|uniref:Prepilin-type N-terminal cleavage/methylation domain-containing protein n=1 Tax=Halorhodospira halophila (strain DSM 244 / SL1) TaxID=349124 RepID=A1WTV1_HALHL|nr:prepilin-type N-terminal cleavage/methylation domain-containing protein [Halorhodospira halophila]ABM61113.1 hypothetical protein Hhal_0319 [Halorhodospira halophila SL1]MBK1729829.1 prepilin-type cleavage/methylation domain-containing protein [Halorhodospira halophila]
MPRPRDVTPSAPRRGSELPSARRRVGGRRRDPAPHRWGSGAVTARHRGVTLIELILVLVILSILAGIAAPRLGGFTDGPSVNAVKNGLISDLRSARGKAMACSGADLKVDLGRAWAMTWESSGDGCGPLRGLTERDGVTVTSSPDAFRLTYPHGELVADDGGEINDKSFEVALSKGDASRTMCVRVATGSVTRGECNED